MIEAQPHTSAREHWFYVEDEKHFGPVTKEFIENSVLNGTMPRATLVWREGLSTWMKAEACPFLHFETAQRPPTSAQPAPAHETTSSAASNEAVEVQYAGLHWRLLAGIIDTIIMAVPAVMVASLAEAMFGQSEVTSWFFIILLWWVYYAALHASAWQGSIGMKVLKLKITDKSGARIDFGRATGRYFASLISSVPCYAGFLIIPFTPKRQGLHDLLCGTLVTRNR